MNTPTDTSDDDASMMMMIESEIRFYTRGVAALRQHLQNIDGLLQLIPAARVSQESVKRLISDSVVEVGKRTARHMAQFSIV